MISKIFHSSFKMNGLLYVAAVVASLWFPFTDSTSIGFLPPCVLYFYFSIYFRFVLFSFFFWLVEWQICFWMWLTPHRDLTKKMEEKGFFVLLYFPLLLWRFFFLLLFVISQMQKSAKQFAVSKQGGSERERALCTIAIYGYRIHVSEMSFWRIYTAETKMRERQRMEVEMRPHLYWMWIEWKRSEHRTQQKKMYRFRRRVEM